MKKTFFDKQIAVLNKQLATHQKAIEKIKTNIKTLAGARDIIDILESGMTRGVVGRPRKRKPSAKSFELKGVPVMTAAKIVLQSEGNGGMRACDIGEEILRRGYYTVSNREKFLRNINTRLAESPAFQRVERGVYKVRESISGGDLHA